MPTRLRPAIPLTVVLVILLGFLAQPGVAVAQVPPPDPDAVIPPPPPVVIVAHDAPLWSFLVVALCAAVLTVTATLGWIRIRTAAGAAHAATSAG